MLSNEFLIATYAYLLEIDKSTKQDVNAYLTDITIA